METESLFQSARTLITGQQISQIPAGQYLQIKHGNPASPTTDLQEQVPAGKKWEATINLTIIETDV